MWILKVYSVLECSSCIKEEEYSKIYVRSKEEGKWRWISVSTYENISKGEKTRKKLQGYNFLEVSQDVLVADSLGDISVLQNSLEMYKNPREPR